MTELVRSIKEHEGFRLKSYQDTKGIWTIGYGHNMEVDHSYSAPYEGWTVTQTKALELLAADILSAVEGCWRRGVIRGALLECNANRRRVLYEMAFQMGADGLAGFKDTLTLITAGRFAQAADEMLDSKWARQDTPNRAARMSLRFRRG